MQRYVFGRDLYEVFHMDNVTERNDVAWVMTSQRVRLDYEMAAQALNVTLGLIAPTKRSYLFACEAGTVLSVEDVDGLITCIQTHIKPFDRFEIYAIENGRTVGYCWFERAAMEAGLITWEYTGHAEELVTILRQQYLSVLLGKAGPS